MQKRNKYKTHLSQHLVHCKTPFASVEVAVPALNKGEVAMHKLQFDTIFFETRLNKGRHYWFLLILARL